VPVPVALPIAAGVLAYANARWALWYDGMLLFAILPTLASLRWSLFRRRLNAFYRLEALATEPSSAERVFLRFEDRTHSYAQTYDAVLRYANWLRTRRAVAKGDLVALDFQNTDTYVFAFLALWAIGARPSLINYNLTGNALVHCLQRAPAKLVLVDPVVAANVSDHVRGALPDTTFDVLTPALEADILSMQPERPPDHLREDAQLDGTACIIYTSGTTGLPKAAVVSWAKTLVVGGFSMRLLGIKTSDVYYTVSGLGLSP
jgi:acyl-CoA synthetase (AMP-forming)/AMP-acid ligase II